MTMTAGPLPVFSKAILVPSLDVAWRPISCFNSCSTFAFAVVNAGVAPVTLPAGHAPCVDVGAVIREHDLLYVSDSAMMLRRFTFETALEENRNLCLLAHPHSWLHPQDDYVAMIREFESREVQAVTDRYDAFADALAAYYERRRAEGV